MNRKKPLAAAAIRKLGVKVEDLLKSSFTGHGMIPYDYYQMFWFQLGSAGGTTEFMPLILNKLISELERKSQPPAKGKEKAAQEENKEDAALSPVLLQGLVNTIMFTTLYLKCNPKDNRILKHLERWSELDKSKKISSFLPSAAEAVRVLSVMKDEAAALNTIVISCSTLRTGKEFQELEKCACLDDSNVPDADGCFFFLYLRAAIVDDASRMEILKATYAKMLSLPAQMKTQPAVAETTLLALLFMLKQFIASGPITDTQFLRKALSGLRQFYLWPKPFGTYTRDILQTLKDELFCPGTLLRTQFDLEAKVAHYKPVKKNNEYGRAVYYLWEADHPESKTRAAIMELRPRKLTEKKRRGSRVGNLDLSSTTRLSGTTQAFLMLNLMAEEKEVGANDSDVEMFSKLTETQIGTLYSKFQEITNNLRTLSIEKAYATRAAELKKFKAEIAALAAKGTAGTTPLPKIPSPYLPELPPLVHTSVETISSGYHQESKDQLGLMCLEYIPYPTTPFEEQLETIFANYATVPKPITVRLVIAGGNKLLHSFLCSYMRMEQIHMEWIKGINIQLFVAPWSSNDLSNFIARHDSWYNRHVHVPSRTPLLVLPFSNPTDELFEPDDTEDAAPVEKPGQFLRETMTAYIRSAQQTLPVNVYLLEGWLDPVPVKSEKDKTEKKTKRQED